MENEINYEEMVREQQIIKNHFIEYGRFLERNDLEDNLYNEEIFNIEQGDKEIINNIIDQAINGCGLVYEKGEELLFITDIEHKWNNMKLTLNDREIDIKTVEEYSNYCVINQEIKLGIL